MDVLRSAVPSSPTMFGDRTEVRWSLMCFRFSISFTPRKVLMDVLKSAVPSSPTMFGDRTEASGPLEFNVLQVFHLIQLVIRPDREIVISTKMEVSVDVEYLMEFTWIFQIN
ncbi:hypothetical protein CDAR_455611 [Caerostris darwini]|uniref:Uncharacterized protein n=1 Tax=Caerostris darwini TaxID=1538125 RepID=A0AAV4NXQ1_9ARAC|nr:hypothetical protein CDAR_455611 [Caerostris darwini]